MASRMVNQNLLASGEMEHAGSSASSSSAAASSSSSKNKKRKKSSKGPAGGAKRRKSEDVIVVDELESEEEFDPEKYEGKKLPTKSKNGVSFIFYISFFIFLF